jgi:acetamidase/formamidase
VREHVLDGTSWHQRWDVDLPPILYVGSGDVIHMTLPLGGDPRLRPDSTSADLDFDAFVYKLVGPIAVEEAGPGDALEIEILSLEPGDWGWTVIAPGMGLLDDEFRDAYLKVWDLSDRTHASLSPGVVVPLRPSLGTVGVHPGEPRVAEPFPPHRGGGNLDNRSLGEGARLWLPVWEQNALLSCGDGHAAQGDGEVCISAIETAMGASIRVHVRKDMRLSVPHFAVAASATSRHAHGGAYGTMGIHRDVREGAREAVRAMIQWLTEEHGLTPADAYVLCSVTGDLRILELVNMGVWNVGFTIPLDVFSGATWADSE